MSYTVLARKYRPQTFEELVGQEHVATTLGNAIRSGRVAHAFLFTGVRGVGKTTSARLLAKALNCESGPSPIPCNECVACKDIAAGIDVDVQEIDGASNNSVDDVRRLQETLPFRPARDRYKIIIVDEVHMLSVGAFNAFLKTLEEPPSHVKFIFATTESHKVPITIRSRCQRYDFRLIPQSVIANRTREILAAEEIEADDAAVSIVAREAAGSMRDALTILDQIVAFGGSSLAGEEVAKTLGVADRDTIFEACSATLQADAAAALSAVGQAAEHGIDILHFARQLVHLYRDLVVLSVTGESDEVVDLVQEELERGREIVEATDPLELQRAFVAMNRLADEVGRAHDPRIVLEMGLVRIATRPPLRAVGELLERLQALEARIAAGGAGGGSGPASPRGSGGRPGSQDARHEGARAAELSSDVYLSMAHEAQASSSSATDSANPAREASTPAASPTPEASVPLERERSFISGAETASEAPLETSHDVAETSEPVASRSVSTTNEVALRRPAIQEWERVVTRLEEEDAMVAAIVRHGVPRTVSPSKIVLAFERGSFYGRQSDSPQTRASILDAALAVLGSRPELEIRFDADDTTQTVASVEERREQTRVHARRREARSHPRVADVMEIFPGSEQHLEVRTRAGSGSTRPQPESSTRSTT